MNPEEYEKIYKMEDTNWWYVSRRRIIKNHLSELNLQRNDLLILDIASAAGANFFKFSDLGRIVGIDISKHSIDLCKQRGIKDIIQADAQKLPFNKKLFDLVFAFDALEHLKQDRGTLDHLYSLLLPGGRIFITVPALMSLWSEHDVAYQHERRYSKNELLEKLTDAGFIVEYITYWSMFLLPFVAIFRKISDYTSKRKNESEAKSDFSFKIPKIIETTLSLVQRFEAYFISHRWTLPTGVSLFCVVKKPGEMEKENICLNQSLYDFLACPSCNSDLQFQGSEQEYLECSNCKKVYPLDKGTPIFV